MLTRRTSLDHIVINRSGDVQVRVAIIIEEDGEEISRSWHRTSIQRGESARNVLTAVNNHLGRMTPSRSPLTEEDIKFVADIHTEAGRHGAEA